MNDDVDNLFDSEEPQLVCYDCGLPIGYQEFFEQLTDNTILCFKCWKDRNDEVPE